MTAAADLPTGDTWDTFAWPEWVPARWRKLIADFWSPTNGRGPADYRQSALGAYNRHPHFGQRVSAASLTATGGAARLVVGNLFAFRATDPADLYLASFASDPAGRGDVVGPDNDQHLAAIIAEADTLIGAWGAASKCFGLVRARVPRVLELVAASGKTLHALRVTKNGQPEHPVRLPAALRPVPWSPR